MQFRISRSGEWGYIDIVYNVTRIPHIEQNIARYEGTVSGELSGIQSFGLSPAHNLHNCNLPPLQSIDNPDVDRQFSFDILSYNRKTGLDLVLEDNMGGIIINEFDIHPPIWHEYVKNILAGNNPKHLANNAIKDLGSQGKSASTLINIAETILKSKDYYEFCSKLYEETDEFGEELQRKLSNYIERLFTPYLDHFRVKDNRLDYLRAFNQTNAFNVKHKQIVENVIHNSIQGQNEYQISWFVEKIGEEDFPVGALNDLQNAILLGKASLEGRDNKIEILLNRLSNNSIDSYNSKREEIFDKPLARRPPLIRGILLEAYTRDRFEFKHLLAHYLTFLPQAIDAEKLPEGYVIKLVEYGRKLAQEIDNNWIYQRATHKYHVERAWQARHDDNYNVASQHFSTALLTLADPNGDWENTTDFTIINIRELTISECIKFHNQNRFDDAANLAEERVELLKQIEPHTEEVFERNLQWLRGVQHESRALAQTSTQQYETALESLNRATAAYSQAKRDHQKDRCIARRHEIRALQRELEGKFQSAAREHLQYTERIEDGAGSTYHEVRAKVCEIKYALTSHEFDQAWSYISEIRQNHRLKPSQKQLVDLATSISDYYQKELTNYQELRNPITGADDSGEYPVPFRDDYTIGITASIAAQRFAQYLFPRELLDELVETALNEALIPNSIEELSVENLSIRPDFQTLDVETRWKARLPENAVNTLNNLHNEEQLFKGDSTGLVRDLAVALEQHLAVTVDYVGSLQIGSDWITELPHADDPNQKPTLGHYLQFFELEEADYIQAIEEIRDLLDDPIAGNDEVATLRNNLQHGYRPDIATADEGIGEEQYNQIKETVEDLMRRLIPNTPAIGKVDMEHDFGNGYLIHIYWKQATNRTWIKTEKDLQMDEVYYFPPTKIRSKDVPEISSDQIIRCDEARFQSFIE